MNIIIICFILVYLSLLILYFFSETSGNFKIRAINKIFLSFMFFSLGLVLYFINYSIFDYRLLMVCAIFFAFLGDVVLLFSFTKGGLLFGVSNILFFSYEWLIILENDIRFSSLLAFILIFTILFGTIVLLTKKKVLNFKTKNPLILSYIASVTLCGSLGIVISGYYTNLANTLFGIGMFLFMLSDYFLMVYKFKKHEKWLLRTNSGCYFIGLLLVVLSLMG